MLRFYEEKFYKIPIGSRSQRNVSICIMLFATIFLTSFPAKSDIDFDKLRGLVNSTPTLLAAKKEFAFARTQISRAAATNEPTMDFSLIGDYPLISGSSGTASRSSMSDNFYVDGLAKLNLPIYDFGETKNRVNAKKFRADLEEIKVFETEERLIFEALKLGIDVLGKLEIIAQIDKQEIYLKNQLSEAKDQFEAGTGTITVTRKIALDLLNLETEKQKLFYEKELASQTFFDKFNQPIDEYVDSLINLIARQNDIPIDFEYANLNRIKKFSIEQRALESEISAIKISKKPKISGALTTRFFDLNEGRFSDYEVFGGVNLSMPIFDSGIRDIETSGLEIKKEIIAQEKLIEENETRLKVEDLNKRMLLLNKETNEISEKIAELEKLAADTKFRAELLGENKYDIVSQQLNIDSLKKRQTIISWEKKLIKLEITLLAEKLVLNLSS